jgi:hypothetical protein
VILKPPDVGGERAIRWPLALNDLVLRPSCYRHRRQQAAASASQAKLPLPLKAIGADFNWVHMPFAFDNGHSGKHTREDSSGPRRPTRQIAADHDDRADFCDGATECGEKGVRSSPRPITNHSKITRGFDAPSGRSRSP